MKNIFIVLFIVFAITVSYSQDKITIQFTDSTEIKGYGRIKLNGNILYRKEKKSEKEIYSYKTEKKVKKVTIHYDDYDKSYEYKFTYFDGMKHHKLLEIYKAGKVNLYIKNTTTNTNAIATGGFGMTYTTTSYYISKKDNDTIIDLRQGNTYSNRFRKKIAPKFFNDCTDLIDKINTRDFFNRYGIGSVVDYYNEKCESKQKVKTRETTED
ncbi:hypothetical protein [uncultured Winogradskyella sp.]|uniref:hypothetical protein n=1 Tax=uncultured Winogradskyella sp. TaxID=395353 RepID=UPI0026019040|nr:hypothetical protein [uncultured Winogradskyella sp.]